MGNHRTTDFDLARDELFSHIHRCGVLKATDEQRAEWLEDTTTYLRERHPALSEAQLAELREIGTRFCQPAVPHGPEHSALTVDENAAEGDAAESPPAREPAVEEDEMVGAA